MNKLIALPVGALIFISCGIKTFYLENKRTRVPVNSKEYINKTKFEKSILTSIDTASLYQELLDNSGWGGIYKFYPNGCFNWYYIEGTTIPSADYFNPEINGYRGVYYMDKGKIKGDLFAPADERRNIGKLTEIFTVSGDTLFVERKFGYVDIYIKRKLPPEYFVYKANW